MERSLADKWKCPECGLVWYSFGFDFDEWGCECGQGGHESEVAVIPLSRVPGNMKMVCSKQ